MTTAPLPLPLVCHAELLAGAERRAAAFPHLNYDWCIKYADRPIKKARPLSERRAHYEERARSWDTRHPDYGGAFDGFAVTSDADGGL